MHGRRSQHDFCVYHMLVIRQLCPRVVVLVSHSKFCIAIIVIQYSGVVVGHSISLV